MQKILLQLNGVSKTFYTADGKERSVLDAVNFSLHEGEIVALLGKSGSGKSTLLRIMAGLIQADKGSAIYRGQTFCNPITGVAMVFQSFALFPWLTVQQNVELGLEAQGIAAEERQTRAENVLEMIGLAGFNGALPRELSGGMRQRVGIARALVTSPDILLMDEAFSALDVLTGETLRDDILELWDSRRISTKAMLVVSHNIEEAVLMADRILLMSSDPGRIRCEVPIMLKRPREVDSRKVRTLIDEVYSLMTARAAPEMAMISAKTAYIGYRLPRAGISRMESVLELLADAPFSGRADLPRFAEESELSDEELFPAYEALGLLGLTQIEQGDIRLTALGKRYVDADQPLRQDMFGQQLLTHIPLVAHIRNSLEQEGSGSLPEKRFLDLLEEFLKADEAEHVLAMAIEWGRYGEIFEYDYHTGRLTLPTAKEQTDNPASQQ